MLCLELFEGKVGYKLDSLKINKLCFAGGVKSVMSVVAPSFLGDGAWQGVGRSLMAFQVWVFRLGAYDRASFCRC